MKSSKMEALVPPVTMKTVRVICQDGPDFHGIFDCLGAPNFECILGRAKDFKLSIKLRNEEKGPGWEDWTGTTCDFYLPVAIFTVTRKPREVFIIEGHFADAIGVGVVNMRSPPTVKIRYSIDNGRRGHADIDRNSYLLALVMGRDLGHFE